MADKIGGIYVEVRGDFTQFKKDMDQTRVAAKKSGEDISNALGNAISQGQAISAVTSLNKNIRALATTARVPAENFRITARQMSEDLSDMAQKAGMTKAQFAALSERILKSQATGNAERALKGLAKSAGLTTKETRDLARQMGYTDAEAKKMANSIHSASRNTTSLYRVVLGLGSALGALSLGAIAADAIRMADSYKLVEGRIRLVVAGEEALADAEKELFDISIRTRQSYEQTGDLYARIARNTKDLALPQRELLSITESINKSLIISGSTTQAAEQALIQLGQAFASGTLRGQELNSVMEQAPRLAEVVADYLGVNIGQLRAMAAEGKITSEVMARALGSQSKAAKELADEFAKMPVTIGQALQNVKSSLTVVIGEFDKAKGVSKLMADAVNAAAKNMKTLVSVAVISALASIPPIIQSIATSTWAANTAMLAFNVATKANPWVMAASAAIALGAAIYSFGISAEKESKSGSGVDKLYERLTEMEDELKTLQELSEDGVLGPSAKSGVASMQAAIKKLREEIAAINEARSNQTDSRSRIARETKTLVDSFNAQVDATRKHYQTLLNNSIAAKERELELVKQSGKATKEEIAAAESEIAKLKKSKADEQARIFKKLGGDYVDSWQKTSEQLQEIEERRTAFIQSQIDIQRNLERSQAKARLEGAESYVDSWQKALARREELEERITSEIQANIDEIRKAEERAQKEKERAQNQFNENMQNNLSSVFNGILNGQIRSWKDAFKSIGDFIVKTFAESIAKGIMQSQVASQASNWLGALLGVAVSAKGNVFNQHGLTAYASGGVVTSPTVFRHGGGIGLMGEKGPEAVMPLTKMGSGNLGVEAKMSPVNVDVNVVNNTGVNVSQPKITKTYEKGRWVLGVVLEAAANNTGGFRSNFAAMMGGGA